MFRAPSQNSKDLVDQSDIASSTDDFPYQY